MYTDNSIEGAAAARLTAKYAQVRSDYCGNLIDDSSYFDAELVENVFSKMKRGKAIWNANGGFVSVLLTHLFYFISTSLLIFFFEVII